QSLQQIPPGFVPEHVLTAQLRLQYYAYGGQAQPNTRYEQILRRLEALPGVEAAAMTTALPTRGGNDAGLAIAGRSAHTRTVSNQIASYALVSPAFFRTLKIPLLAGRVFTSADDGHAPQVVVVNETMAKRFWPGENPVGRALQFGPRTIAIIGVVGDTQATGVARAPKPQLYSPYLQRFEPNMRLIVRTTGDPRAMTKAIGQ